MFLLAARPVWLLWYNVNDGKWFVIVQESFFASSSWRVESSWSCVGESDLSDFPRRVSCSSPRSKQFRDEVDVLRHCCYQKIFTVASATRNMKFPLLCGVKTSIALTLRSFGKCVYTLCLPEPGSAFARGSIGSSWDDLEVSRYPRSRFHRGSERLRSLPKNSLKSCIQSSKSCNRSTCTSSSPLIFGFRFLLIHAAGFSVAPHSYFHFFQVKGFRCICWRQIQTPVMRMMKK